LSPPKRRDGAMRTVFEQASRVVDQRGQTLGIEGITQDITERVQARERIRQLAHYDGTTGLPNQQFFAELAGQELEVASGPRPFQGCQRQLRPKLW
jgi:PAS domain-containing protein